MRGDRARDGYTGALGVEDAADQRREILDPGRIGHLLEGLGPRTPELDLAQRPRHEQGQRVVLVAHQLLERPIEAEARLHADRDHVQRVRQRRLELGAPIADELVQPEHRQVEPEGHADHQGETSRKRCADEHADRGADGAEPGRRCDAERLQTGGVEVERVAHEIELAAEVRGLRVGRQAHRLAVDPAPKWSEQSLEERLLEPQRHRALAEAHLLAGEALARKRCGVGRA